MRRCGHFSAMPPPGSRSCSRPTVARPTPKVDFLSRGGGYTAFFTPSEAVFVLNQHTSGAKETDHLATLPTASDAPPAGALVLRLQLLGANPAPVAVGLEELPGVSNYFIGNDPVQWRTGVPSYARVLYRDVYPGIDLVYYGSLLEMEYDFIVAPGADPSAILLRYEGAERLSLDPQGNLVLQIQDRRVTLQSPLPLPADGRRQEGHSGWLHSPRQRPGELLGRRLRPEQAAGHRPRVDLLHSAGRQRRGRRAMASAWTRRGTSTWRGETNSTDFPTTSLFQASNAGSQRCLRHQAERRWLSRGLLHLCGRQRHLRSGPGHGHRLLGERLRHRPHLLQRLPHHHRRLSDHSALGIRPLRVQAERRRLRSRLLHLRWGQRQRDRPRHRRSTPEESPTSPA